MRAVMDAAGSRVATVYGWSEGGPMCLMFAATYRAHSASGIVWQLRVGEGSACPRIWAISSAFSCRPGVAHWGEGSFIRSFNVAKRGATIKP